jgi:Na+/melibiose symporter-like transporter
LKIRLDIFRQKRILIKRLGGYINCEDDCCTQPDSVGRTLRLLVVPGPIVFILTAIVFLYFYPINEKRREEIQKELQRIREENSKDLKAVS